MARYLTLRSEKQIQLGNKRSKNVENFFLLTIKDTKYSTSKVKDSKKSILCNFREIYFCQAIILLKLCNVIKCKPKKLFYVILCNDTLILSS